MAASHVCGVKGNVRRRENSNNADCRHRAAPGSYWLLCSQALRCVAATPKPKPLGLRCELLSGRNSSAVMQVEKQPAGLTYQGKPRTWGLRFSILDGVVLVLAAVVTVGTWSTTVGWSGMVLFVVLHFFLFCNVFRIRRKNRN